MSDDYKLEVYRVPTLDTGIGQAFGYEDDTALLDAAEAERATWPPEMRAAVERYEAGFMRRVMFGAAPDEERQDA